MTIQEFADIAARYYTTMATAMLSACIACAIATGEALDIPERPARPSKGRIKRADKTRQEYERMMRRNSDTRHFHQ